MSDESRRHDVVGDLRHYGAWLRDHTTVTLAPPPPPRPPPTGEVVQRPGADRDEPAHGSSDPLDDLDRLPPPPLPRLIPIGLTVAAAIAAVGFLLMVVSGGPSTGDATDQPVDQLVADNPLVLVTPDEGDRVDLSRDVAFEVADVPEAVTYRFTGVQLARTVLSVERSVPMLQLRRAADGDDVGPQPGPFTMTVTALDSAGAVVGRAEVTVVVTGPESQVDPAGGTPPLPRP